jgi:hypothetical protein
MGSPTLFLAYIIMMLPLQMLCIVKCNLKISHKKSAGIRKAVLVTYFKELTQHSTGNWGKPRETCHNISIPTETHTRHLPNTILGYYCITNLFGSVHL